VTHKINYLFKSFSKKTTFFAEYTTIKSLQMAEAKKNNSFREGMEVMKK